MLRGLLRWGREGVEKGIWVITSSGSKSAVYGTLLGLSYSTF